MNLRNKLQFFTSGGGGGKLNIILPIENQSITLGQSFSFEVTTTFSDLIDIYIGSVLIGTVPVISGTASGTLTIPERSFTFGTIYKVEDGQEIQISNIQSEKFRVISGNKEKEINVKLVDTNNYFDFTPATSIEFWHPEIQQSYTTDLTATTSIEFWHPEVQQSYTTDLTATTSIEFEIVT